MGRTNQAYERYGAKRPLSWPCLLDRGAGIANDERNSDPSTKYIFRQDPVSVGRGPPILHGRVLPHSEAAPRRKTSGEILRTRRSLIQKQTKQERRNVMPSKQYESCIEACNECVTACEQCAVSCLHEQDIKMMVRCIELDRDCADICSLAAQFMSRGSTYAAKLCALCADICQACGDECAKHKAEHCQQCAKACHKCAEECRNMAKK